MTTTDDLLSVPIDGYAPDGVIEKLVAPFEDDSREIATFPVISTTRPDEVVFTRELAGNGTTQYYRWKRTE